jgi:hypothetical protein
MATGTLVSVATPALAAPGDPTITINSLSSANLQAGSQATLKFTVKAGIGGGASMQISVASSLNPDVTLVKDGANCGGTCQFVDSIDDGQSKQYTVTLVAAQNPNVPAGQQKSGNITITADPQGGGGKTANANQGITLQGAAQQNTVVEISGVVKEAGTNQPIPGANVEIQDDAGHNYGKKTDNFGKFSFKSSAQSPIIAGNIAVAVAKDGYGTVSRRATVQAGQSYSFQSLTLASSASPSTSTSAAPADTGTPAAVDSNGAAAPPANNAAKNSGGGSFSMILIGLGVLLVLLGIGAIAFILIKRRRDDADEDGEYADDGPQRGPTPVPASRGAYHGGPDPTAVRSAGYADPTVVGGRSPMADAPTMMHSRPPVDEYPDPYGAPPPANYGAGGYDERGGQYGGGTTYGGGQTYGAGQYGSGGGAAGGYDDQRGSGYDDRGGYDNRGGGYDDRGGYDPPGYDDRGGRGGYRGGTYGHPEPQPPARERYDEPTTYEPRGYDQRGGYEPRGGGGGGYDPYAEEQRGGGYDQRGGYEQEQPRGRHGGGGNPPPDSRRQLDWLDD